MSITLKKPAKGDSTPKSKKSPGKTDSSAQDSKSSERADRLRAKAKSGALATITALWRTFIVLAPFLVPLLVAKIVAGDQPLVDYFLGHLALLLVPAIPFIYGISHVARNHQRTHPPRNKNGRPVRPPEPALPSLRQRTKDAADIIANLDTIPWRVSMIGAFLAAVGISGVVLPLSVDDLSGAVGAVQSDPQAALTQLLGPIVVVLVAFGFIGFRVTSIIRNRSEELGLIYAVARDTLDYPKRKPSNPTKRQATLVVPHQAIDVKKWRSLENVDTFFVLAPEELSVEDVEKWDSFAINLNAKVPRKEEWRIQRDPRGRGANVGPANYPRQILWDGDYDPNPLAFILGDNLEVGSRQHLTFGEASPHMAISGGTSSGKTSGAEIIAAQVLVTPMPWDPTLYGEVHIIDPKGPFARRWRGRPGVITSNGQDFSAVDPDVIDEETGNVVCQRSGILVMAEHVLSLVEEEKRLQGVLGQYPDAGTWIDLPDEVKRAEKMAPKVIIFDEFLDHTSKAPGNSAQTELENEARETIVSSVDYLLRRARNIGFHVIVIAQRANMKLIGDTMMTNMPVRMVTGQIDPSQLGTMFGTKPALVPALPSVVPGSNPPKTIPGRARIMNAAGQAINKVQVMYFGGSTNSQTLDKWLPRGHKPPNGDFTPPGGTPRRIEDFDENGEYIGDKETNPADVSTDEVATGAAADAGAPAGARDDAASSTADEAGHSDDDAEQFIDESPAPINAPSLNLDKDAVFPAAQAEAPRCEHPGCVNDGVGSCPECGEVRCEHHLESSPDPSDSTLLCIQCRQRHPLAREGVEGLYRALYSLSRRGGLLPAYTAPESGDGVVLTAWTPKKQKVIEVTAEGGELTARSRAGTVTGNDIVPDNVEETLTAYIRLREQTRSENTQP